MNTVATTTLGKTVVVVTVMVLHELSIDASELATSDASTAVFATFLEWFCQCPDCPMITKVPA